MGYGLSRVVVVFPTGPLLKKLWPLEVDLLTSSVLWSAFGFVCSIFSVVGFVLRLKYIFHKYISVCGISLVKEAVLGLGEEKLSSDNHATLDYRF